MAEQTQDLNPSSLAPVPHINPHHWRSKHYSGPSALLTLTWGLSLQAPPPPEFFLGLGA